VHKPSNSKSYPVYEVNQYCMTKVEIYTWKVIKYKISILMHFCFIKKTFKIFIKIKVKYQLEETRQQITTAINIDQLQILSIIICLWKPIKPRKIIHGNRHGKRQSRMDNSEMQAILGTRHNTKKKKKKQRATRTPPKNGGEPRCPGNVRNCCFF